MKDKPNWLRLLDILTFGGLTLLAGVIALYASLATITTPHAKEGLTLLWVVALTFAGIWGRLTWLRKKELDQFTWFPKHGFMVNPGGYLLPSQEIFNKSVEMIIAAWERHFPQASRIVDDGEVIWVWMSKELSEKPNELTGRTVKGFVIAATRTMAVDYDLSGEDWDKTAFRHELGHIIMGEATRDWNQDTHHTFAAANGLP
jgi:hypothetical protein